MGQHCDVQHALDYHIQFSSCLTNEGIRLNVTFPKVEVVWCDLPIEAEQFLDKIIQAAQNGKKKLREIFNENNNS